MLNNMISWSMARKEGIPYDLHFTPDMLSAVIAVFKDKTAVIIRSDTNNRNIQYMTAEIWSVDFTTGMAADHITDMTVPIQLLSDIRNENDLRRVCVSIKHSFNKNRKRAIEAFHKQAVKHAQDTLNAFYNNA